MIRSKPDEDEYWNSSKFRAFTFDDEDDEFSSLKESKRAVNSIPLLDDDEDEDEVEKVSWSGEPVGSISWSIKETASSTQSMVRDQASFPKIETTPSLTKQGSGYSLSSLFKALSEVSTRSFAPELRKPKSEYKDYVSDWTPEETVKRMRRGKVYSLESFRSLKDKLLLLDEAVSALDGNVITAVIPGCLGRTEEMALLQYRDHLNIKDEVRRKDFLKNCISLPFAPDDATHVQDHYTLLERQIIIEGTYSSPANIRQTFKISEKQYFLTALGARAKLKAWLDVDSLFTTKNWLGYTKKRSPIGFHRVVDILQKNNAPVKVLQDYLYLVEDTELRISLAQKHKCHDIIIDTYKDLKDRQQLIVYRGKVERGSPEDRKIEALLNSTVGQSNP
ncbi:hypothetical protein JZ751_002927 [Albula glossodonta]|uniref:Spermatogenesis-defective protein 39 homolog n=1 Tax=Albula glossodonta TaxID=121402 RepID=A0A8T2NB84_9TELE|nr:hypothetical protein JZ751_002927 [Albula glossodonta]